MTVPYDQIVFIGYVIDTAPKVNPDGTRTYLGLADPAEDIAARCELLSGALQVAASLLPPPASPPVSTLYVFVAPEFFFRGDTGAYAMDDVQLAVEGLQAIAADAQWDNWAFEFGTIVGQYESSVPGQKVQIVNFALVQEGGLAAQGADGARAIVKELKSRIDFIAQDAFPGGLLVGAVEHPKPAPPHSGSSQQLAAYDGAGIFAMYDITWAVEICLDYYEKRLQQSPQLPGNSEVQVQIVPSCGADIEEGNMIAQPGGYIFNVDGMRKNAHANLFKAATPLVKLPLATSAPVNIADVMLTKFSPPQTVPVSDLYANGSGTILVYAPVPVPPALTVPGSTDVLTWHACSSPMWSFTFTMIYDAAGKFTSVLCTIHSSEKNFEQNEYDLPLSLDLTFEPTLTEPGIRTGTIEIVQRAGAKIGNVDYEKAIYAEIKVPGFNFQGDLMQFMNSKTSPYPIQKIWPDPTPKVS